MTFEEKKAAILARRKQANEKRGFLRMGTDGYGSTFAEASDDRGSVSKRMSEMRKPEKCKYAQDTGEVAFPAAPCRGNRILCQHPQNAGFVSYGKQCRREKCVFFDAET